MRVILQRIDSARIVIDGAMERQVGKGLFLLIGVREGDSPQLAEALAKKCAELRIFEDEAGKMNFSAQQLGLDALVVSNFTLYANTRKGRRPSFVEAAGAAAAVECYNAFLQAMKQQGLGTVQAGEFGADMMITSVANGPVTILFDSDEQ